MKQLVFQNTDGSIQVTYTATLKDPSNLNEPFYVQTPKDMETYRELNLFYFWIRGTAWTLNEMIFFAINNNLCLGIFDGSTLEASYGICGGIDWRVFSDEFDDTFA